MDLGDYLHDFYKEIYFHELDRKDRINSRLNFPVALFTLITGANWYLINSVPKSDQLSLYLVFYGLIFIAFMCLIVAAVYLLKCIFGQQYDYISDTKTVDDYVNDLSEYNNKVAEESRIIIEDEIRNLLREQYCKCSSTNSKNNLLKSTLFQNALRWLVIATVFMTLSIIPFLIFKHLQTS